MLAPLGFDRLPEFSDGWLIGSEQPQAFLTYVGAETVVNWSSDHEYLHEESSRDHFLDRWTRSAILRHLGDLREAAYVVDVGCSTGYLLADLEVAHPSAILMGVDLVPSGLRKAHVIVPRARLLYADACGLPLASASVQAVVSANLLEHIADDRGALAEIARILEPGGRAVIVVPAGAKTYDYYDRYLGHERRYARNELAAKARSVGLSVEEDIYLASLLYPVFWLAKRRNQLLYDRLTGVALQEKVASDIARTGSSRFGSMLWRLEERLAALGVRLPWGVRELIVLRQPLAR